MKFFGSAILTTFLFLIALSKTTLASAPIPDYSQSRETEVEGEGKWSISYSPGVIESEHIQLILNMLMNS
jgi:hypothetical protein